MGRLIADKYKEWEAECNARFDQLKANEEELNRIFIDIYGLQDELTPEVEDKDVTVRKADLQREIRSLISYAVGCMFGRYSVDVEGLCYAGGNFSDQWLVVSGQYYHRKVIEYYVGKGLSRAFGMEEIDGSGRGDLQIDEAFAERGVILAFGSNEESGGIDTFQYSRGTTKKLYEGIRELSLDSKGIERGASYPVYDLCSPEILNAVTSGSSAELVSRGWKDAERVDWKAIHRSLTTDHFGIVDADNIIPICDDDYFDDDMVGLFIGWVKTTYGADTLEQNLAFIANALSGGNSKLTPREVIRGYFINGFYEDHLKVYQKRPIYWMFSSGKKNGFKALIYMHRYQPDLLARMRTDYVHEQQERYRTQLKILEDGVESASPSEKVKMNRQISKFKDQSLEIQKFEEKIHHLADQMISIDLDDGVKVNYAKFGDVLEKIK